MTDKQIIIDGKECRYWFRLNPGDYRKCSLRGENDNCEEIKDCFVKELLKQLKRKEQECEELKEEVNLLRQYKGSKQASYESMQEEKNKAIFQNRDLLKQVEGWQEKYNKLEAEQDKIKAIGDNYFDEYEMCCLDLPDAIDSLLKRYDNAFIKFKKERKELKEDNEELKRQYKELGQCSKRLKDYYEEEKKTLSNRFLKLKQTLANIKEIAITGLKGFCSKCSRKECEDNNCIETAIRDILQLISEVENDRQS